MLEKARKARKKHALATGILQRVVAVTWGQIWYPTRWSLCFGDSGIEHGIGPVTRGSVYLCMHPLAVHIRYIDRGTHPSSGIFMPRCVDLEAT